MRRALLLLMATGLGSYSGNTQAFAEPQRPQEQLIENKSRPYLQQQVRFNNEQAGISLAGTISFPRAKGPFPTVLLVAASGPMTRDEEGYGHKSFEVLADYLNSRGIAVMRYDKRGVGSSEGQFDAARFADFVADAKSAVSYLESRADVRRCCFGILGHSEGGTVAAEVAAQTSSIQYLILLGGSGVTGIQLLTEQRVLSAADSGVSSERIPITREFYTRFFSQIAASKNSEDAKQLCKPLLDQALAERIITEGDALALAHLTSVDIVRDLVNYSPTLTLERLRIPVLAVVGSLDHTVSPKPYVAAIQRGLAHNPNATVKELPKLNHMFQTAKTGKSDEFGLIEETFSPIALTLIGNWIDHREPKR